MRKSPFATIGPAPLKEAFLTQVAATLCATVLLVGPAQGETPPAAQGRVIATAGERLEARADGAFCAARVKVIISATDPKLFEGEIPPAAKFFTNARAGHSLSCPRMTRMVAQGKSGGKVMFTAMADQSNGWEALILGATALDNRAEEAALASAGPTPKSVFRSSPAFDAASKVLTQTQDKYLCLAGDALACEVIIKFTPTGADKVQIAYRQALSGGKSTAAVTTPAVIRDGFFCADPDGASVVVEDAQMSDDAKKDYAEQLQDRVKSNGEICTGFSGKPEALTVYAFDVSGKAAGKPRTVKLYSSMPAFTGGK